MNPKTPRREGDIAVVGASALYPGSVGGQSFWTNILSGRDFMSDVPPENWLVEDYYDADPRAPGKVYAKRGGFLPRVDFDPMQHGLPPRQLGTTDTAQLLGLVVAQKVLDDAASVQFGKVDKKDISVILGVASATELVGQMAARIQRPHWTKALRDAGLPESEVQALCDRIESTYPEWDESTFPGLLGNVVAGRIANRLNLGGTNCVVDAACASSLGAVAMAVQELQLGHSDLVITGGVDALNDIFMFMCFSKTPALSPTGDCRPFSEDADGTMLGEGLGMVALRRLEDAERDGDKIYAVIRGIGSASDGRAKSIYAPRAEGQELAIRRAYERAGYGPDDVGLVEAHGTATKAGDAAEFEGLQRAFGGSGRKDRQWCALGSIKSQIGHTKAAAGAASLFKVVMALHHKVLPPTVKVSKPNAKLGIENSPFYLNTKSRPWIQASGKTRKGSVSSFGFGGSNFHIALEEYNGSHSSARRMSNLPVHLLLLSADDTGALLAAAESMAAALDVTPLEKLGRESQVAFAGRATHRLALLAADSSTARGDLAHAIATIRKNPELGFSLANRMHYGIGADRPKLAFLFPGQGSQYVGMGDTLAMEFNAARKVWDETASLSLDPERKLHEVVYPVPVFTDAERQAQAALLTRTDWAQPAIGATSLSMLRLLEQVGVSAQAVAGHSYGEIAALYAAGAVASPDDMLTISRKRGELMNQSASVPGAMMAIRGSAVQVGQWIARHNASDVRIANINSPSQVVVAGVTSAIDAFQRALEGEKVVCQRLPVATAFHTELVAGCAAPFAEFLAGVPFNLPRVTVYTNTTASPYPATAAEMRENLAQQLARPVHFENMIHRMYDDGSRLFIEVGPGSALTGMVGDCLKGKPHVAVSFDHRKQDGRAAFLNVLGVLSSQGIEVDYATLWQDFAEFDTPQDTSKLSPAAVKLGGANYGKPYPPVEGAAAVPRPNPERPVASSPVSVVNMDAGVVPGGPAMMETMNMTATTATAAPIPVTETTQFASVPPAAACAEPAAVTINAEWVAAFECLQQQTLEAQKAFTQTLSESHQAFLRTSETAFLQLGQLVGLSGAPVAAGSRTISASAARTTTPAMPVMTSSTPVTPPVTAATQPVISIVAPVTATPNPVQPAPAPVGAAVTPVLAGVDHQALLMEVVSEKTGYPVSMLTLDMELEAGLGIDSIKRVEILAALQEKIPQLAGVDTSQLAALNTLGEIVAFASRSAPTPVAGAPVVLPSAGSPKAAQATGAPRDFKALLLDVVADKTGYPVSMLTLDMELEAGLGIDSIKRVEILAALQEQIPQLAGIDTSHLATLNTLGEILDFTMAQGPAAAAAPAPAKAAKAAPADTLAKAASVAAAPVPAGRQQAPVDHKALLLQVVAEKTGYPESMLTLDMELEAGLGIDSIKRVEILAALQERIPQLAHVDTGHLASLNTLGEILDFAAGKPASAAEETPAVLDAAEHDAGKPVQSGTLLRLAVIAIDAPPTGLVTPGLLASDPLYLVGDESGLASTLAEKLAHAGIRTAVVSQAPVDARAVMILSGLRQDGGAETQASLNETVFSHLQACAASMAQDGKLLVTVQDTGGDFGLGRAAGSRAWSAGIAAAAKTAALEWPHCAVKAIDIERTGRDSTAVAEALVRELLTGGPQLEVGLKTGGRRVTLAAVEETTGSPVAAASPVNGVVVVTGGARGVTAACLAELAARYPGMQFAILGRTALVAEPAGLAGLTTDAQLKQALLACHTATGNTVTPQQLGAQVRDILAHRELRHNLDRFAALNAQVRYFALDVTDRAAVGQALGVIREEMGPVSGLIHAAGVLADKEIRLKTLDQFCKVFDTKVGGLRHLLDATRDDALTRVICFSSVAARHGNIGQIDYAMANEVLNRICHEERAQRGPGCLVKAIGWGPWAGGMVDAGLEKHFSAMGVSLIPLQDGARLFADEFAGVNGDTPEIVYGGGLDNFGAVPDRQRESADFEVRFHHDAQPWIGSHVIRGIPVVPMVVANDLALQAVRAFCPDQAIAGSANLNVVKGIQLQHFHTTGDCYRIECRLVAGTDKVAVRIVDTAGVLHYTLDVLLGEQAAAEPVPVQAQAALFGSAGMKPWQPASGRIYDGRLFHGPDFQVIQSLEGTGPDGCAGILSARMSRESGAGAPVDLLDGGLQLAVLWLHDHAGCESLPTGFRQLRMFAPWVAGEAVNCDAVCETRTSLMSQWTLHYRNASGALLVSIEGVKIHLLPDSPSAPTRDTALVTDAA